MAQELQVLLSRESTNKSMPEGEEPGSHPAPAVPRELNPRHGGAEQRKTARSLGPGSRREGDYL